MPSVVPNTVGSIGLHLLLLALLEGQSTSLLGVSLQVCIPLLAASMTRQPTAALGDGIIAEQQ